MTAVSLGALTIDRPLDHIAASRRRVEAVCDTILRATARPDATLPPRPALAAFLGHDFPLYAADLDRLLLICEGVLLIGESPEPLRALRRALSDDVQTAALIAAMLPGLGEDAAARRCVASFAASQKDHLMRLCQTLDPVATQRLSARECLILSRDMERRRAG